jgi:repressor LexA
MNAPQPSQKEQALYRYLYEYSQEYGYTPSFQEMVDHTGARTKSHVAYQLKNLEAAGWIEKTPNTPRAIRLTREIFRPQVSAPIQLVGVIQAGAPIPIPGSDFAFFLPDDAIEVGGMLPPQTRKKDLYALRVEGDSMIDSNVQDRDIVIMEPTREARNGDMVAAWLIMKEETTLKHFYKEKDHVKLKPANPSYPTQTYRPNEIEVHGRVMMVIRSC